MFYDCMGRPMSQSTRPGLCELLHLNEDELMVALISDNPLDAFLSRYFYERDIMQVRKNEWLVCIDGESAANAFDEMPLTFKTKDDAVAWVHDNNEGCKVRFVSDDDDCVIMLVTNGRIYEKLGHGVAYAASILDEESHSLFIQRSAEAAAKRVCEAFWFNRPVPEYAERVIRFYFECVRDNAPERLTELNGANDAVPPKD